MTILCCVLPITGSVYKRRVPVSLAGHLRRVLEALSGSSMLCYSAHGQRLVEASRHAVSQRPPLIWSDPTSVVGFILSVKQSWTSWLMTSRRHAPQTHPSDQCLSLSTNTSTPTPHTKRSRRFLCRLSYHTPRHPFGILYRSRTHGPL